MPDLSEHELEQTIAATAGIRVDSSTATVSPSSHAKNFDFVGKTSLRQSNRQNLFLLQSLVGGFLGKRFNTTRGRVVVVANSVSAQKQEDHAAVAKNLNDNPNNGKKKHWMMSLFSKWSTSTTEKTNRVTVTDKDSDETTETTRSNNSDTSAATVPDSGMKKKQKRKKGGDRESPWRSASKGLTWRVVATSLSLIIAYAILGGLAPAIHFGVYEMIAETSLYFLHERIWNKVSVP